MIDIKEIEKYLLSEKSELDENLEKIEAKIADIDIKIKILNYFKDQPVNECVRNAIVRIENSFNFNDEVLKWFKMLGFETNHTFEDVGDGNQTEAFYIKYNYNSNKE